MISRIFSIDPNRSSGIPLNPQFRNPPPGALDPATYDDPVTLPAADIAGNPYWKRDVRRQYAQLSTVTQGDVVALLSVGSKAQEKVALVGEAGAKQLVAAQEEGSKGLAAYLSKEKSVASSILEAEGMPPMPPPLNSVVASGETKYELLEEQSYGER